MNPTRNPGIAQTLLLGAASLCAAASAFFGFLYYELYWKYRGLFNEQGRYFDEADMVVHHDDAAFLIVPTIAALLLAFLLAAIWWNHRRAMLARVAGGS